LRTQTPLGEQQQDDEELAKFEAIASAKLEDKPDEAKGKSTNTRAESNMMPFNCLLTQQQRERLFEAINQAKSAYELKTTAEALDVLAQEQQGIPLAAQALGMIRSEYFSLNLKKD